MEPVTFAGTVDVTSDDADNPVSITDLRPIRYQKYLHHTGMIHNSLPALAVRIETLAITSSSESVRPPRKIAAALALYLASDESGYTTGGVHVIDGGMTC